MALKTRKDYEDSGKVDAAAAAADCLISSPYPRSARSWQAVTYWRAYDAELARLRQVHADIKNQTDQGNTPTGRPTTTEPQMQYLRSARQSGKSILTEAIRRAADTTGWPPGATEHARRLVEDLCKERNDRRRLRLITALHRMAKRHGVAGAAAQRAADIASCS